MTNSYREIRKRRIERDIASFADPGGVKIRSSGRAFVAEWTMRGVAREATFMINPERGDTVRIDATTYPYTVFLAGTQMANLRQVAQMIIQSSHRDIFVPTRACLAESDLRERRSATELLRSLVELEEAPVTEVIMVTGEAGAGKTRVLQELVLQQADSYLQGQAERLLLYVNAQGRALARLDEALATELQDLKVALTYHSVAALVRVGLLVPVIDGFDELLGVSGYDDAFNSLATFLDQLDGYGRLIASARSVYYEDEFRSRASRAAATGEEAWAHIPVEIVPWDSDDRNRFLEALNDRDSVPTDERWELRNRVARVFQGNQGLASKPLFVAKTVDVLRQDRTFTGGDDLLGTLTLRYLEREQKEKLLGRLKQPLVSEAQLEQLLTELAEEMWNQETRELDRGSVREVAEYTLHDKDVSESARQIILERIPALAFLTHSERHETFKFEHEVFFFYFLARQIANKVSDDTDLSVILSRSALPEMVADRLALELCKREQISTLDALQKILNRLSEAASMEWRRSTQVQENAGLIVLALLRTFSNSRNRDNSPEARDIKDLSISNVVFPGSNIDNVTLHNCTLTNVCFRRTSLITTRFIECYASAVVLEGPIVKVGSTRLELIGIRIPEDVQGIRELRDDREISIYDPQEFSNILGQCGASVPASDSDDARSIPTDIRTLLDSMIRAYEKANLICDGDQNMQRLFGHHRWPELRGLLIRHGVVKFDPRSAAGSHKEFLRRQFRPDEIMLGASKSGDAKPQIVSFWEALEGLTS